MQSTYDDYNCQVNFREIQIFYEHHNDTVDVGEVPSDWSAPHGSLLSRPTMIWSPH